MGVSLLETPGGKAAQDGSTSSQRPVDRAGPRLPGPWVLSSPYAGQRRGLGMLGSLFPPGTLGELDSPWLGLWVSRP